MDFPANPLAKPGYRLVFHDEFDAPALDRARWLPHYLPQWHSRAATAARYALQGSELILRIDADQPAWCPEFDGPHRCSALQTGVFAGPLGSPLGQSRFSPHLRVREAQPTQRLFTFQYGYVELRATAVHAATNHVSLWLIGFEATPAQSAEICVCEIMGAPVTASAAQIGYGLHPWADPAITDAFYTPTVPIDATAYHLYAAEWTPTFVDFFVDNQRLGRVPQSPRYPLQLMLGLFERPAREAAAGGDPPYPKQFRVDYVRVYQPEGGYAGAA